MGSKIEAWLEEETDILVEPEEDIKPYRDRVVGWLDILGIRSMIKNTHDYPADEIMRIMMQLQRYLARYCDTYVRDNVMVYHQIADGFMLVADIEYAATLCEIIAEIQWNILFDMGLISRGAITMGNVSVSGDGNLIIGPAYVDAYAMESENALFARVIVSKEFINNIPKIRFTHICEDTDQSKYIDYVAFILDKYELTNEKLQEEMNAKGIFDKLLTNRDKAPNISVYQKYGWTLRLLNRHSLISLSEKEDNE